jgi:hypothetical protein
MIMALTKVTNSMISGDVINVFDYMSAVEIADVKAETSGVDVTAALQNALDDAVSSGFNCVVYMPAGTYKVTSTLTFKSTRTCLVGSGFRTQINFTGATTVIDFDGWSGSSVSNLCIYSSTADIGINIKPNVGATRFAHWWELNRVMIIGNTPDWSTTALATTRAGFATAAFRVETAFYGQANHCEATQTVGNGFYLLNQANGNTFTGCQTRNCATGVNIDGNLSSNGNTWSGGNIEASTAGSVGIFIGDADRNIFMGRMEVVGVGSTHVILNPPGSSFCQDNQFIGLCLTGSAAGYVLGDGSGLQRINGTFISGGKLGASVTINNDCLYTWIECTAYASSGVTVTDDGFGSVVHINQNSPNTWYERVAAANTNAVALNLTSTGTGKTFNYNSGLERLDFTDLSDAFRRYSLDAGGTYLAIMRFGAYRLWVSPTNGKLYINGADPTTPTDGTVVGTQT